jgi:hypothetical protein
MGQLLMQKAQASLKTKSNAHKLGALKLSQNIARTEEKTLCVWPLNSLKPPLS